MDMIVPTYPIRCEQNDWIHPRSSRSMHLQQRPDDLDIAPEHSAPTAAVSPPVQKPP
jgi:hypothetical protein